MSATLQSSPAERGRGTAEGGGGGGPESGRSSLSPRPSGDRAVSLDEPKASLGERGEGVPTSQETRVC